MWAGLIHKSNKLFKTCLKESEPYDFPLIFNLIFKVTNINLYEVGFQNNSRCNSAKQRLRKLPPPHKYDNKMQSYAWLKFFIQFLRFHFLD